MSFAENFLTFIEKSQYLKSVTRHSWTSNKNRRESTAEHTWHMSLMAMTLAQHLTYKVDLLKVLKMITIHDLGEALTGDIPAFKKANALKQNTEEKALKEILLTLTPISKKELHLLWKEYTEKKTKESIFVKMLDVIDVLFQHLVADISTWTKIEYRFNTLRRSEKFFKDEKVMSEIYELINKRIVKKLRSEGKKEWQQYINQ